MYCSFGNTVELFPLSPYSHVLCTHPRSTVAAIHPHLCGELNYCSLSLSVLTAIFQVTLGYPAFIEAKDDGSGGDNWSYKLCKAPVRSSPPTNQHPVFFTSRMSFLSPNQQCRSTEGKNITFHGLAYHKLTWGSSNSFVSDH